MLKLRIRQIQRRHRYIRLWRKIALAVLGIAAVSAGICSLVYCINHGETVDYASYTVNSGDTLWSIAEYAGGGSVDVREVIYLIEQLNDIENSVVYRGEKLIIPIYNK